MRFHTNAVPHTSRRRGLPAAIGAVAVAALLLTGCGGGSTADGGPDGAPVRPAVDTDTVVIAIPSDVNTVDMSQYEAITDTNVLLNVFDTLTFRGEDGGNEPHLATDWTTSEDGLTWTLTIRDGVTFHNGDPMTAEDVAFSIERAADPVASASLSEYWGVVDSATALDDTTVEVKLSEPSPLLLNGPGQRLSVLPKKYFDEVGEEGFVKAPVATGPYKFVSWEPGNELVLEAFDDFWDGPPPVKNVVFRVIPEEASRVAALRSGEVDFATSVGIEQVESIEADPTLDVRTVAGLQRMRMVFDTNAAPFDDVKVRQAINHAIDVDEIIDTLLDGYAKRIPGIIVPAEAGYDDDLPFYDYDPEKAKELLAEAGYPDGFEVDFAVRTGYLKVEEVAQAIAGYLSDVGIDTKISLYTSADYSSQSRDKTLPPLQLTVWTGGGQFNGAQFFDVVVPCGDGGSATFAGYYCNPEIDELITEAYAKWIPDNEAALDLVHQAQKILWDEAGAGFLYQTTMVFGTKAALEWEPTADGNLWAPRMAWAGE